MHAYTGFIILVELLIDASLIQPFYEALAAVKPHRKYVIYFFFVLFYCIGQLVVLNLVVAFILDAFMEAQESEEHGGGEGGEDGEERDKLVDSGSSGGSGDSPPASVSSLIASTVIGLGSGGGGGKGDGNGVEKKAAALSIQHEGRYSMP